MRLPVPRIGHCRATPLVRQGALAAALTGGIMSLIHAVLTVHLKANQVVSGLALTTEVMITELKEKKSEANQVAGATV